MGSEGMSGRTLVRSGLTRRAGSLVALDNLSFSVASGRVTGFFGLQCGERTDQRLFRTERSGQDHPPSTAGPYSAPAARLHTREVLGARDWASRVVQKDSSQPYAHRPMDGSTTGTIGDLVLARAIDHPELLARPVQDLLFRLDAAEEIGVAAIDPEVADTAAFCARYGVHPDESANCVVVAGRREGVTRHAACVVLATDRADVNGFVRRRLDVRKVSFAPMEDAVSETGMEHGGITPIGLPVGWPILVDSAVADHQRVVVGSGLRSSKLVLPGRVLGGLPYAEVVKHLGS